MLFIDKQVDVQEKHYIFITSYKSKQTNRVQFKKVTFLRKEPHPRQSIANL